MRWMAIIAVALLLFVPLHSASHTTLAVNANNVFYVGGSGSGNYSSIQAAIDDAGEGATIYVYSGLYDESVVVRKNVSVVGKGEEKPVVNGGNRSEKTFQAEGVSCGVRGIVVANGTGMAFVDCMDCEIMDVVVRDSAGLGLVLRNSSGCHVERCDVFDGNDNGIHVRGSYNNYIADNKVADNAWNGIAVFHGSKGNVVTSNTVTGNLHGIDLSGCANNFISDNMVYQNDQYGMPINSCTNLSFTNNSIHSHPYAGLQLMDCHDCTVTGNEIYDNGAGVMIKGGYRLPWSTSYGNVITRNDISNNSHVGLYLEDSRENQITENNFINQDNMYFHFFIKMDDPNPSKPLYNDIDNNYWSDWSSSEPKPIQGQVDIAIWLFIFEFPWHMYDENPATEPYDW